MLEFMRYLITKWFVEYRFWSAVVALILAGVRAMTGWPPFIPSWVFTLAAIAFAYAVAIHGEWRSFKEKKSEVKCDMSLSRVIARIVGEDNFMEPGHADVSIKVDDTLSEIREAAHHERIFVWGRANVKSERFDHYILSRIPATYWAEFAILYNSLLSDVRGETWRLSGSDEPASILPGLTSYTIAEKSIKDVIYSDLYFSRAQVDRIWPDKVGLRLRWPIEIKLRSIFVETPKLPEH